LTGTVPEALAIRRWQVEAVTAGPSSFALPENGLTAMPSRDFLAALQEKRQAAYHAAEAILLGAKAEHRELNEGEQLRYSAALADLEGLTERVTEYRGELARAALPSHLARINNLRGGGTSQRAVGSAGRLSPMGFSDEQLRRAHSKLAAGETAVLESRDFSSADSLLPAQLFPIPTFPRHEARLMDRLPGFMLEAQSLEYVVVTSVTGAAAIVGEGQLKPEIVMPPTKQLVQALKLAAHSGVSWENISDYDAFTSAVQNELLKRVIDLENQQLVYGTGGTTQLSGMTTTTGILTFAATGTTASPPNNFDDIAGAIAALRTGPALAEPDLLLLNPDTWAAIRTQKDLYGRYLASANPTDDQAETVWGIDVLQSTEFTAGEGVLLDTTLFGRVAVREPLVMRVGYGVVSGQSDFISNILRWIAEERLNLAVERPAAICHITGLPTAAPTTTATAGSKREK
jgi:HK97 family phage major capsid protein